MASVKFFLSKRADDMSGINEIMIRFCGGRDFVKRCLSGVFIHGTLWDADKGMPKEKKNIKDKAECNEVTDKLRAISEYLVRCFNATPYESLTVNSLKEWMDNMVLEKVAEEGVYNGMKTKRDVWTAKSSSCVDAELKFIDKFTRYVMSMSDNKVISDSRKKSYNTAIDMWGRFELYCGKTFMMTDVDAAVLDDFRKFGFEEYTLWTTDENGRHVPKKEYEYMYSDSLRMLHHGVHERSRNYMNDMIKRIKVFWHYMMKQSDSGLADIFIKFKSDTFVYGTPYFISKEDRNGIYHSDLGEHPSIAVQRDIYIFQSLVGCRVQDLLRLKTSNVIDGETLQYIAKKTVNTNPETISVPLHPIALEIINRYSGKCRGDMLLPFISSVKYNIAIKKIFELLPEYDRTVTVLNPVTRCDVQKKLSEVASSHMARRNFCGILSEAGFSDSDIGSMSGHKEGSREISRYRVISDVKKKRMIDNM